MYNVKIDKDNDCTDIALVNFMPLRSPPPPGWGNMGNLTIVVSNFPPPTRQNQLLNPHPLEGILPQE